MCASITAPLVKTLLSRSTSVEPGIINPMCWTEDLLRIYHLETLSTYKHPSPEVKSRKNQWTFNVLVQLLQSGAARRLASAEEPPVPPSDASRIVVEVAEINQLVEAIKNGEDPATGEIEVAVTWIVARKAMLYGKEGPWMSAWHRP